MFKFIKRVVSAVLVTLGIGSVASAQTPIDLSQAASFANDLQGGFVALVEDLVPYALAVIGAGIILWLIPKVARMVMRWFGGN